MDPPFGFASLRAGNWTFLTKMWQSLVMKLVFLTPPIPLTDVAAIEAMVNEANVIFSPHPEVDAHSIESLVKQHHVLEKTVHAIIDRNIMSELAYVARKGVISSPTQRISCGILAFLQLGEAQIEPGVAALEYSDSSVSADPTGDLSYLRALDNVSCNTLAALALNRVTHFDRKILDLKPAQKGKLSSGNELHQWKLQYGYALKIALLELMENSTYRKLSILIDWMWSSYVLGGVSLPFAAIYYSQRFSGMLKGINSADITKALKGVRNAAWDLTIVHYFTSRAMHRTPSDPFFLFCSQDKALMHLAQHVTTFGESPSLNNYFARLTTNKLSEREVNSLIEQYQKIQGSLDHPDRAAKAYKMNEDCFDSLIQGLEDEFKAFLTKRGAH